MAGPHVKVCGLTRRDDVAAAVGQGAWAVGFVMWSGSPRSVTITQLRGLTTDIPPGVKRVAVAVNPAVEAVRRWRGEAGLTTLQLHGGEDADPFLSLGMDVFKAVSLETDADVERAAALPAEVTVLVDAHDRVRHGGTGTRADWARAAALSRRRPVILAGGLRADNVQDAIAQVNPWAIDVSSGLESEAGIKDIAKLRNFFAMLRSDGARGFCPGDDT